MTVEQRIVDAIKPYAPCSFGAYLGSEKTYCYYLLPKTDTVINGDNEPVIDKIPVQIHLFTPNNYIALKRNIKAKLFKSGFTYPYVTSLYESDTKLNHIIFECDIIVASEKEEV